MQEQPSASAGSPLSTLDKYWVQRSLKPSPLPREKLICYTPEHWIKYVFPSILYLILVYGGAMLLYLAMISWDGQITYLILLLIGVLLLTAVHHWFFWFLLAESQACIIVTNKRVIYLHSGLLWSEEMIEVAYEKMKTVEAHKRTILQSILNFGTLQFEPMVKIKRIPHPGTMARQIEQAMGMD